MGQPVTVEEVLDYLGAGEESKAEVKAEIASALAYLARATGADCSQRPGAAEAVKLRVWLTFYGIRGGAQNTQYLEQHLTDLVKQLQYANDPEIPDDSEDPAEEGEDDDPDGEDQADPEDPEDG